MVSESRTGELSGAVQRKGKPRGKPFPKGVSPNPGGQSKEKRAFLDRLRGEDAAEVYAAFLTLVREGNAPAVLRAAEYLLGKPPAADEDKTALAAALTVVIRRQGGE